MKYDIKVLQCSSLLYIYCSSSELKKCKQWDHVVLVEDTG